MVWVGSMDLQSHSRVLQPFPNPSSPGAPLASGRGSKNSLDHSLPGAAPGKQRWNMGSVFQAAQPPEALRHNLEPVWEIKQSLEHGIRARRDFTAHHIPTPQSQAAPRDPGAAPRLLLDSWINSISPHAPDSKRGKPNSLHSFQSRAVTPGPGKQTWLCSGNPKFHLLWAVNGKRGEGTRRCRSALAQVRMG